jgi:flagellar biosynthesis protein FlhF
MKIIRHTARDMRQALRAVREQLGEDAVILSSRRTGEGVEVTAAVDFDASTLEAGGFADTPAAAAPPPRALAVRSQPALAAPAMARPALAPPPKIIDVTPIPVATPAAPSANRTPGSLSPTALALTTGRSPSPRQIAPVLAPEPAPEPTYDESAPSYDELAAAENPAGYNPADYNPGGAAYTAGYDADWISDAAREAVAEHVAAPRAPVLPPAPARVAQPHPAAQPHYATQPHSAAQSHHATQPSHAPAPAARATARAPAASAIAAPHITQAPRPPTAARMAQAPIAASHATAASYEAPNSASHAAAASYGTPTAAPYAATAFHEAPIATPYAGAASYESIATNDPVEEIREATLTPLASNEVKATFAAFQATGSPAPVSAATEAMGNELKTLRRMLETQLAHLAWNDLTRRAPVHTEILRELTEIGITQDLAEHLVRQLPEDTDLTFARRFTIAGLSQYLKVTGDRWLDDGGRVAFVGATGVGKTTTLAKIAVRWVLRHGPRDIALVAADPVRIGAQDQLQSLAQMLGVPVYTPETFEHLPTLLPRLSEQLILIDTPGASVRDNQLGGRLAVLSNSASKLETALVLAASTQAGAIEEAVRHFAPANPSCCVLTKLDEAASLGGVLSALVRARLPVSYMSEGQRVPEDLRPARALELVSAAVRLAKARGAAADEDLLRRRFGKNAHGIS